MKKLRLYLETSVWSHYYADDVPEKREITRDFFENVVNLGKGYRKPLETETPEEVMDYEIQ